MDKEKVFSLRQDVATAEADVVNARTALESAEAVRDRLKLVDLVLSRLSRDWRQKLNQAFDHWNVDRFAFYKKGEERKTFLPIDTGGTLYWAEELIPYPDGKNGLDTECESVKKNRVGPIADAATEPCAACGNDAYVIHHIHAPKYRERDAMAPHKHYREFLLCLHCVTLTPSETTKRCNECIA